MFHTDQDSLMYLVNKPDLSGWIARWILLLQEFNYKVVVKPGKTNSNADFLSTLLEKSVTKPTVLALRTVVHICCSGRVVPVKFPLNSVV